MNLHRFLVLTIWALFTMGCTSFSPKEVTKQMDQFRDLNVQQLIAVWGVPSKQFELDGKYFLEWHHQEKSSNSSISVGTGTGGRGWFSSLGVSIPLESTPDVCIRQAQTDSDKQSVIDLKWRGDSNYCGKLLAALLPKKS